MTPFVAALAHLLDPVGGVLRRGLPRRHRVDRARPVGGRPRAIGHDAATRRCAAIILPQAVKRMLPAFMERAIELMKTTTLVATISYADLLFQANEVSQKTFRPLEVYTVVGADVFRRDLRARACVARAWSS
jgi:hypothetical protein